MPYLEVAVCGMRGVLSIQGENDWEILNKECSHYIEVTKAELEGWEPIIRKYHEIVNILNNRKCYWGSPNKLK